MVYQIIYSSESSTPMQWEDLEEILERARSSNFRKGITGALLYVDGVFLQILEGERACLQELMERIFKDVRHEKVTILKAGEVDTAAFADWKMAYVSATTEQVAKWAGLGGTTALPSIVNEMRQDPQRVAQLAQSVVTILVAAPTERARAE